MDDTQITLRDQLSANMAAAEGEVTITEQPQETTPEPTEGRSRDELGRFTAKQEEQAEASVTSRAPRPSSWKKEMWDHWEKLDPQVADYINQREGEYAKGVSTYKTEWERAKPILAALDPFMSEMQKHNITPDQWIQQMGGWHARMVSADPQSKLQEFQRIAQHYGVPLQSLLSQETPQVDPQSQWLMQQVNDLRGTLQSLQTTQEQREQQQYRAQLEEFSASHKHYEQVRETMAGLLQAGLASDLNEAYEAAIRHPKHNDLWQQEQDTLRKEAEAKVAEEKRTAAARARAAAVQVKGTTPGAPTTGEAKDLRSQISENLRAMGGRV